MIARAMGDAITGQFTDVVVAPCLPFGCSDHHLAFTGTVSVTPDFITEYLHSAVGSFLRYGFRYVYVFSAHAGNNPAIDTSVASLAPDLREKTGAIADWPGQRAAMHRWAESSIGLDPSVVGSHAGHIETSIMLHLDPDLVDMDAVRPGFVGSVAEASATMAAEGMAKVSDIGVIGDPTSSTAEAGAAYLDILVGTVTDMIESHRSSGTGSG
jgi:creatinine amidohydrolase